MVHTEKQKGRQYLLTKTLTLMLLFLPLFVFPNKTYSHAGGGPPFVKLNGTYAMTNPLFSNQPEEIGLRIPQDLAMEAYVIRSPITFSVDLPQMGQFGLDQMQASQTEYRWKFYSGDNYDKELKIEEMGSSITKSFTDPGTYLVTLEAHPPSADGFTLLTTIAFDVMPKKNYALPKASLTITSNLKAQNASIFTASSVSNISSYLWSINGSIKKGKSITYTVPQEYYYDTFILRVVDTNGLKADTGVLMVSDNGKLSFSLLDPNAPENDLSIIPKDHLPFICVVIGGLNAVLLGGIILSVLRRKRNTNRK